MKPEWEPIRGFVPCKAGPSASVRMNPRKFDPRLILCCKLGILLLCLGVVGKITLCTSSLKIFSFNVLNNSFEQDINQSHSENSTFLLTLGPQPVYFYEQLEQELRQLARNCTFKNNSNAIGNALITMLRDESLSFGTIMNLVQVLKLGIEKRVKRTATVEQQVYNYIYYGSGGYWAKLFGYSKETAFKDKIAAVSSSSHEIWF